MRAQLIAQQQQDISFMDIQERIRGVNFDGSAKISQNRLQIELIQYIKGSIYRFSVTSQQLGKSFKRFLVIKKLQELFQELVVNHQSYIDQSQELIIPIQVQYRGRTQPLSLEIPLQKVIIQDQRQLNQKYLKEIQKMSKENLTIDRYKQKILAFIPDPNSTNLKSFDLSLNRNTIRFTGNNIHTIINHIQPLSKVGIHSIKAKIIKTYAKNIIFGVCAFDIRYSVNNYHSPYFLGLSFSERTILGNNKSDVAIPIVEIIQGKSIIKVEYDMNKSVISWFLDDNFLCARRIPNQITMKDVYPIISIYNLGDTVEIAN